MCVGWAKRCPISNTIKDLWDCLFKLRRLHPFGVVVAEEIVGIPRGTRRILSDKPATEIRELCILHGLLEIEVWLLHVVLRLVIPRGFPVLENGRGIDFCVVRFESRSRIHGGDALLDEGILIAADEDDLFGHGVGAEA